MLDQVCQLARNAGDAIMQVYDGTKPMDVVSKADNSPVTAADIAAHTVIMDGLRTLTPDIPVLSEEDPPGWEVRQHWQRYWLVDPLDGTKEFIKRNGEFTVNINNAVSSIVTINTGSADMLTVNPPIADTEIHLDGIPGDENNRAKLYIFSVSGMIVHQATLTGSSPLST